MYNTAPLCYNLAAMQIEPQSEDEWFAVIAQMDEEKVDNGCHVPKDVL